MTDPKSVIKAFIQNEKTPIGAKNSKESKEAVKFSKHKEESNPHFKKLLEDPCFQGFSPRIVDQVFYLEKYRADLSPKLKEPELLVPETSTIEVEYENPGYYFSTFEIVLILFNVFALIGISFTIYIYGVLFYGMFR
mmetsp:Transcript_32117/g.46292  ORF Transcript_32117/g.46292 Transcript_32117/m.46292 type:complete len:137 (+) Transcript_32117:29-439(+)